MTTIYICICVINTKPIKMDQTRVDLIANFSVFSTKIQFCFTTYLPQYQILSLFPSLKHCCEKKSYNKKRNQSAHRFKFFQFTITTRSNPTTSL